MDKDDAQPRFDDGHISFSTSICHDDESNLLAAIAIATWQPQEDTEACLCADGQELAHATVWAYDATKYSPSDLGEILENLVEECNTVSSDLYEAASAAFTAYINGEFQDDDLYEYALHWLILDHVEVHEDLRGFGLGRAVAAYALYTSGVWYGDNVAIASIAGATLDLDKWPRGGERSPEYSAAWNAQQKRSARLLEGLGLRRLPSGVYVGHAGYDDTYRKIRESLPEKDYRLPRETAPPTGRR